MVVGRGYALAMVAKPSALASIKQRLRGFRDTELWRAAGYASADAWCVAAGQSRQNLDAFLRSETRDMKITVLFRLCEAGRINPRWLLFGEGNAQLSDSAPELSRVQTKEAMRGK